jgi:hypothetical protein
VPNEALTNATVEWIRRMHRGTNALDELRADWEMPVTDDFIYNDRRSGGMNFGQIDASGVWAYTASMWDVGDKRPQMSMPEIVAVRGDRLAAVVELIAYGDDVSVEGLVCYRMDPTLRRLQRAVIFDVDEADAAINELDRMHDELTDESTTPS